MEHLSATFHAKFANFSSELKSLATQVEEGRDRISNVERHCVWLAGETEKKVETEVKARLDRFREEMDRKVEQKIEEAVAEQVEVKLHSQVAEQIGKMAELLRKVVMNQHTQQGKLGELEGRFHNASNTMLYKIVELLGLFHI